LEVETLKVVGMGLIEFVKVSGPYLVAVLGTYLGYLGNKSAKEISLKVAEMQNDKDLSVQKENHKFEDGKRISEYRKDLVDRIVKELEPTYSNSLALIKSYYSICGFGEPFNEGKFNTLIKDRFFSTGQLENQLETERSLSRASAYISIIADMNISVEMINLRKVICDCNGVVEWDGENWGRSHTQKVTELMQELQIVYLALFVKLGKSLA
jgi:hypothetical protein